MIIINYIFALIWARGDFYKFVKNNLKFKKTFAALFKILGKNSKR